MNYEQEKVSFNIDKEGWIKLYRQLMKKAIWKCSTPEQKVILITLLLMADHEGDEWEWQSKKFKTEPGQFVTSLKSITEKAGKGISIQNVRTSLEKFKRYEFLTYESTKTGRLITIENWELYQSKEENQQSEQQRPNKELTPNKNNKNDKNIYNAHFDTFWEKYPRKTAKAAAKKVFDKLKVDDELLNQILEALEIQKQSKQWSDKQYIPYAATFINQKRWEDEAEEEPEEILKQTDIGLFKL